MTRSLLRLTPTAVGTALLALATLAAGPAAAEQSGRSGVVVSLDGSVSPDRLPRHDTAPVSITLSGSMRSVDGSPVPRLARIDLAFGARGGLSTAGLPRCPRARLRASDLDDALRACGRALVGSGTVSMAVHLPEQRPLQVDASLLAFNGRTRRGRTAVWVLVYPFSPALPVSIVLPFHLRRAHAGAYDVLLSSRVSRALGPWIRLRSFHVTFGRRYRSFGERRSYLSASCPLPPRFRIGFPPLARATYHFASGPTLTTTILRACRVRD